MSLELLGQPLAVWCAAALAWGGIAVLIPAGRRLLVRRWGGGRSTLESWRALVASMADRWLRLTTLALACWAAVSILRLDGRIDAVARGVAVVSLAVQALVLAGAAIDWAIRRVTAAADARDPTAGVGGAIATRGTLTGLRWVFLIVVYALVLLVALQNLGVDVTAMIAGLGIGGVAIALAVQNILGDLFASLSITLDKPFVTGDFIVVGDEMGTVEQVGLKTTRVRSLSGEQLVFSNSDLLKSRIRNYKRMTERRVTFTFGVSHSTALGALEGIPTVVRQAVEEQPKTRFDRAHLKGFGESSLDYEVSYLVDTPDYNEHMDVLQAIHLRVLGRLRRDGVALASPTLAVTPSADRRGRPAADKAVGPRSSASRRRADGEEG